MLLNLDIGSLQTVIIPQAIPGIVFAGLTLLYFFVVIGWIIYKYCPCCWCGCCDACRHWNCWKCRQKPATVNETVLMHNSLYQISGTPTVTDAPENLDMNDRAPEVGEFDDYKPNTPEISDVKPRSRIKERWAHVVRWMVVLLAASTVILGIWGIPQTLVHTNSQINQFWNLLNDIQAAQAATSQELHVLNRHLSTIKSSAVQIAKDKTQFQAALESFGVLGPVFGGALDLIQQVASQETVIQNGIGSAIKALDAYIGDVSNFLLHMM